MRTSTLVRLLFAAATAGLAAWSLVFGAAAVQSMPAWIPWAHAWVYGWALIALVASLGLCFSRTALPSILLIGLWRLVVAASALPGIVASPLGVDAWYPCCQALTSLSAAWIVYALLRREGGGPLPRIAGDPAVRAAQALFGATCVFYGWSHFVFAGYTAGMVPVWLPGRLALAYCTGLCHAAAGVALIIGIVPRLAATLEATMMSLFGALVWVPSFFVEPRPSWARPSDAQWSELLVTVMLAVSAWIVAISLAHRRWIRVSRPRH